jgi:hypothetical protein
LYRVKTLIVLLLVVLVAGALFWFATNSRASTETPEYRVVKKFGALEIRDYPDMKIARTAMDGGGMNGSFGRLFRFITGANDGQKKIAMTTPVLIAGSGSARTMGFIVPAATAQNGVPAPTGGAVKIEKLAATRYAALRFSGGRNDANEKQAAENLRALLTKQNIRPAGEAMFAYYDPPWTPLFMRRNEVMMRIENGEPF